MHHEIKDSGLGESLGISSTINNELSHYIGKKVRYKRELLKSNFLKKHGLICKNAVFEIKETQKTISGQLVLRGYTSDRDFGRPIDPEHIEVI
jgi:predicted transcriptional regulator YdeE